MFCRNPLKLLFALAGCFLFVPAVGHSATVFYFTQASFNAAAPGAVLLENFSSATPDVKFSPTLVLPSGSYTGLEGDPSPHVLVASPGYTNFGANVGVTTQFIATASGDENIVAAFSTPYSAVGFDAFFNGLGPVALTVFGSGNSVLGTLLIASGLNPITGLADKGYLGFTSDSPIYGFQWDTTLGREFNTGFTNISVVAAVNPVPLPAALPLFVTGLGALGLLGWRRKRKNVAANAA